MQHTRRFTLGLHQSFYDSYMIYLLIDFCPGGELYDHCQTKPQKCLSHIETQFYAACVVLGLTELHSVNIVYRDLKLENLIIDRRGFLIVADFGLAKRTTRTYTVCGTPEYMAPELVLSTGHDRTADLWSLGILTFEMSCGGTPFEGGSPMETYENIVQFNDNGIGKGEDDRDELPWSITTNSIDSTTKAFIHGLLQKSKRLRLGSRDGTASLRQHTYFNDVDWIGMVDERMNYEVPFVPESFDVNVVSAGNVIQKLSEDVKSSGVSTRGCYWKPEGFTKVTNE